MNAYKKLSHLTRLLLLVVLVVNTFAPAISLRAQETTPDAPPVETTPETTPVVETPTDTPTEAPPPTPTEQPPVVIPPQNPPTAGSLFLADFNTGDTSAFLITGDWAVVGDSATFTTSSPSASAIVNGMLWDNFIAVTSVTIAQGGEALIGLRVGAESYAIRISDSGNATLWRGLVQIGGVVAPIAETTPDPLALPAVYEVAISAIGGTITVAVNNVTQITVTDPLPLVSGYVVFGTTPESLGAVGYDNLLIQAQVPVSEEPPVTPVEPVETPIIIPPLDPTPENTPVVEVTVEVTEVAVEPTEVAVEPTEVAVEVTAEVTEVAVEVTPELTPDVEATPDVEVTPELTPAVEVTPEVTETAIPLSLDEAEIAKLDGVIYDLLEAYYGGDEEGAHTFATENYIQWREDGRLQVWVYPYAVENIPALAVTLLELGGEVLYLSDTSIDVVVTLEILVEIARDGRIFAITLPVPAVPTSTGELENNSVGTPQLLATTGTGFVIPHTLDQLGISSWHEADVLGAGVNIAVIDTGFEAGGYSEEQACLGNAIPVFGVGTGSHGLNVVEILCDVAPSSQVWTYTATDANSLATAINAARAGVPVDNIPPANLILITLNPNGTNTDLDIAVADAFNNNVPIIASAGNGGAKNTLTFDVTAGGITTLFITAHSGNVITITPTLAGNNTAIQQVGGSYSNTNAGTVPHAYTIGSECGDICQLELVITRDNADTYTITSNWAGATIIPDATVVPDADADELIDYTESYNVLAVGSVCGTQIGRFPLTESSPQGALGQANTARMKPDLVAPTNVSTSLLSDASVSGDFTCTGGFSGASASASHVAGMAALVMSNPAMVGIHNATTGRPWQLYAYLKSRALDVNGNGFDRAYGAGVAQLGDPLFNLGFEIISVTAPNNPLLTVENTIYVSSDRLSAYNIIDHTSTPTYPLSDPTISVPDGTLNNPFTHITDALAYSVTHPLIQHIVLMPGEYPSSFIIPRDNLTLWSYDSADSGEHPASRIWVSDTFNGSGIVINGRTNITLNGLVFNGATPDYSELMADDDLGYVTPLIITNSAGITITNSTFDRFDASIQIISSQNVVVRENTFRNFEADVANTTVLDSIIKIVGSGATTPILLERNLFQDNTIPASETNYLNGVVYIQASQSRLFGNQMIGNTAQALITINMWQTEDVSVASGRNIVYSNVFADNTLAGPIVHLAQGEQFQFINNTVAKNVIDPNITLPGYFAMIGLGRVSETFGGFDTVIAATHKVDIHNNIFFANRDENGSDVGLALVHALGADMNAFTCTSLITDDPNYARHNWFIGVEVYGAGICTNSSIGTVSLPENGNEFSVLPSLTPQDIDAFTIAHFMPADTLHPYQLKDATITAVDRDIALDGSLITGVLSTTTLLDKDPAIDPFARDVLGNPRFVDQVTTTYQSVDMGAYELVLGDPLPPSIHFYDNSGDGYGDFEAGDFSFTMTEDGVAQIDMSRMVESETLPYEIDIIPHVGSYDDDTGNVCGGQPYDYDSQTYILTYCPLPNFHNQGVTTPESQIWFEYQVTDTSNNIVLPSPTTYATMTLKITAVDDGIVVTTSDRFIIDASETLPIYITPMASLTSTDLILPHASGVDNLDYPFTYSNFGFDLDAPDYNYRLTSTINFAEDIVDGVLTYTPPFGVSSGAFELTYVVTDQDGDTATQRVRVVVVDVMETRAYDDTSPHIRYVGEWTPQYDATLYQRTKHSSYDPSAYATFSFTGDKIVISNPDGAVVLIDVDGSGVFTDSNQIDSCIASTVTKQLYCNGLNAIATNAIRTVRIEVDDLQPEIGVHLDYIKIDTADTPTRLGIGVYEDTDLTLYSSNITITADSRSLNGSWAMFGATTSQIEFVVTADVKRLHIYRPMDTNRRDLRVELSNGCTTTTFDISSYTIDARWQQKRAIDLNGCKTVKISYLSTANPAAIPPLVNNGIDAIALLGDKPLLGVGNYSATQMNEFVYGNSVLVEHVDALDGVLHRLIDGTIEFDITADVRNMVLYRLNNTVRDAIRVECVAISGSVISSQDIANTSAINVWASPALISIPSGCVTVRVSRAGKINPPQNSTSNPALERITLFANSPAILGIGTYDDLQILDKFSAPDLQYTANALNGTWTMLNSNTNLTFTVTDAVKRVIVYRPMDTNRRDLRVELSDGCVTTTFDISSYTIDARWQQKRAIDLNGCKTVKISYLSTAHSSATTPFVNNGIDAIALLGDKPLLGAANYSATQMNEFVYGNSVLVNNAIALDSVFHRLIDGTIEFDITTDVRNMILYRLNNTVRDAIRVECVGASGAVISSQDIANTSSTDVWSSPTLVSIPSGCETIRVSRAGKINPPQNSTSNPVLERITLYNRSADELGIGMYDDLQILDKFSAPDLQYTANALNGTWTMLNSNTNLTFTVTDAVKRVIVYRPMDVNRRDLRVELSNGCTTTTFDISSYTTDARWQQKRAIDLNGCKTIKISYLSTANSVATTPFVNNGIDAIELLSAPSPLMPGNYGANHLSIQESIYGDSALVNSTSALGGWFYRLDGSIKLSIDPSVDMMVIYRMNINLRDHIRITAEELVAGAGACPTPAINQTFTNTNTTPLWSQPIVVKGLKGMSANCRIVISRVSGSGGQVPPVPPVLEWISLFPETKVALEVGIYDNIRLIDKFATGTTTTVQEPLAYEGTWNKFSTTGSLTFSVASTVKQVVIYRHMGVDVTPTNKLRVQLGGSGCAIPYIEIVNDTLDIRWQQTRTIDLPPNCTTVTITSVGTGAPTGIDAIELLPAPSPLTSGNYDANNPLIKKAIYGDSALVDSTNALGGWFYRLDGSIKLSIDPSVDMMVIYRMNFNLRDHIRITAEELVAGAGACPTPAINQTFSNTNTTTLWSQPIVVKGLKGMSANCRIVISRVSGSGGQVPPMPPIIERITLVDDSPPTFPLSLSIIPAENLYDNLDLASKFTNSTIVVEPLASASEYSVGGQSLTLHTWHQFSDSTANLTFTVYNDPNDGNPDNDVKRIMIYRQMDSLRDNLFVSVQFNSGDIGCSPYTFEVGNDVGDTTVLWNQPHVVNLNNCTRVQITPAGVAGRTNGAGIDKIALLPAEDLVGAGTYLAEDLREFFTLPSATLKDIHAIDGSGVRMIGHEYNGIHFRMIFKPDVSRMVIYRHNTTARSPLIIYGYTITATPCNITTNSGLPNAISGSPLVLSNTGTDADWGHPIVIDLNGCRMITMARQNMGMPAPTIEQIVLLSAPPQTLTAGNLYQEYHTGLTFSANNWEELASSQLAILRTLPSHRTFFTNDIGANATFTTTGNRFVVNHRSYTGASNNVKLCISTDADTDTSCSTYSTNGTLEIAQYPVAIFGLHGESHAVTITNQHNAGNLFIDAVYVP